MMMKRLCCASLCIICVAIVAAEELTHLHGVVGQAAHVSDHHLHDDHEHHDHLHDDHVHHDHSEHHEEEHTNHKLFGQRSSNGTQYSAANDYVTWLAATGNN